jgi:[acyl-carrier-protein] S-malonyltransferase
MMPAVDRLIQKMKSMKFFPAQFPVWSNVTGKPHDANPDSISLLLARQVVEPVLWEECMQGILGSGEKRFFEVGPGKVLAGLLKRIQRKAECLSIPA